MRRPTLFVVGLAAVGGLILSGCSGGSAASNDQTAASKGKVTGDITFQTWNLKASYQDYFTQLIKDFEAKYPGTKVKWIDQPADGYADKLTAQASSNTLPDVINIGPGPELSSTGMLLDINKVDPSAKNDFLPGAWDAMTWGQTGEVYGYPWYLSTGPSLFNTALMSQAGLDPNNLPTTYDQLFADADKMAAKAGGQYTMVGSSPVIEDFGKYGSQLMNKDHTKFTFNDAKGVDLVNHYKELYDHGGMLQESLSQTYTGQDTQFQSGKIAYMPGSAYNITQLQQNAPTVYQSLKVAPMITNEKPNMYVQSLAISAHTKNQPTAIAFAKFVTSKDEQMKFAKQVAVFPSTVNTLNDPYFTQSDGTLAGDTRVQSAAMISNAAVYAPPEFTDQAKTELRDQVALAIEGKKSAQAALDDAVSFANDQMTWLKN